MSTSTVPAVLAKLADDLPGVTGGVSTFYGIPVVAKAPKEGVYIDSAEGDTAWAAINAARKPRDEAYEVTCFVSVIRGDGNARGALERAFAIHALIEAWLISDPTLGGIVREAKVGSFRATQPMNGDYREGLIEFAVAIKARI